MRVTVLVPGFVLATCGLAAPRVAASVAGQPAGVRILRVDARAHGAADGSSWADAFPRLETALAAARGARSEVWIAAGRYTPSAFGDRAASFELASGVAILGGFAGTESSPGARDPRRNLTILSGDLGGDDGSGARGDNSFHVLRAEGVEATAVLDGVIVEGGHADGTGDDSGGGGLLVLGGSPTLRAVTFRDNAASTSGGAVHVPPGGIVRVERSTFVRNRAAFGGALAVGIGADALVVNTSFHGNTAAEGGAIGLTVAGAATLAGVVASGNRAERGGAVAALAGAMLLCDLSTIGSNEAEFEAGGLHAPAANVEVRLSILARNRAAGRGGVAAQIGTPGASAVFLANCIEGLAPDARGNLGLDPDFADADGADDVLGTPDDDLRLSAGSPCIDAATTTDAPADLLDVDGDGDVHEPLPIDRAGRARSVGVALDFGAYERARDCDGDGARDDEPASDCDGNGHPDACDVADGIAADLDGDRRPDACPTGVVVCAGDGTAGACPCANFGSPGAGCANSLGAGTRLVARGAASVANDTLVLTIDGAPDGAALYVQGTARRNGGMGTPFDDGLLCVAGTLVRLGQRTNARGGSALGSLDGVRISGVGGVSAPESRTYQTWYRDLGASCGAASANLTNAVRIEWRP